MRADFATTFLMAVLVLSLPAPLVAESGEGLATALAENVKLLRQYSHKQRIDIKFKGEDKDVRVDQVKFDSNGKRQVTPVSETHSGHLPLGPIRRAGAEKKRAELKDYANRLKELVESYLPPDPEKLRASLATAESPQGGTSVHLVFKNYLKTGDNLALTIDAGASLLQRVELTTSLDQDPITVTANMSSVPNGPRYPGLTKITSPAKDLEIDISEYDFIKQ